MSDSRKPIQNVSRPIPPHRKPRSSAAASIADEIVDEIGVARDTLSHPQLVGVQRQLQAAGRPSLVFSVNCSVDEASVRAAYAKGPAEAFESTALQFMSQAEAAACELGSSDGAAAEFTVATRGALWLWRRHFHQRQRN